MEVQDIVAGSANIVIGGSATGAIDLGAGTLAPINANDIFVARYGMAGQTVWSRRFGGTKGADTFALALGQSIILATRSYGAIDFGGGALPVGHSVIAALDWSGGHLWSKQLANSNAFSVEDVELDASGNIFLIGTAAGDLDLGGGTLPGTATGADVVIAKLDSAGSHLWSQRFAATGAASGNADDFGQRIAATPDGAVLAMGNYSGSINFGGQALPAGTKGGTFVVKLDASGKHVFSRGFVQLGGPLLSTTLSLSPTSKGGAVGTLALSGPLDLGLGAVSPVGAYDALVFFIPAP
jgi:hypothetical protein